MVGVEVEFVEVEVVVVVVEFVEVEVVEVVLVEVEVEVCSLGVLVLAKQPQQERDEEILVYFHSLVQQLEEVVF